MKVKESQQSQFFASYAIDIHANEFQPTNKASLLLEEQTYFQLPSSPVHQRRNQKSWRIHISGKFMYSFLFFTVSYWVSSMNEHFIMDPWS